MNFSYTYDNRGNIVSETCNDLTTSYEYDALGQLIRVDDPHERASWKYYYDFGDNITKKEQYVWPDDATSVPSPLGNPTRTIPYTYADANWKDKLTSYDGKIITYDAIGNPLNDGERTYTWGAGRQLQKIEMDGKVITFQYNHSGLRTQKQVVENGVTTTYDYTLHGKLITHLTKRVDGTETARLHFFYDSQSRPAFVRFGGEYYRYIHNLQGDIVAIVDTSGNTVVEYKYDAWGNPISITGSKATGLGKLNPFRYRGYVYDEETGLYYLRSRYYNPVWGRFVNADSLVITELLHCNNYAYCIGNPTGYADSDGTWPSFADVCKAVTVASLVVAGTALAVTTAPATLIVGVGIAASGTVAATALTVTGSALGTAAVATTSGIIYEARKQKPQNLPSAKKVTLGMDHIMSGHGSGGNRGGPNKDRFPDWVTATVAEKIIRTAYRYAERVRTQGERVFVRGPWDNRTIEMWVNTVKKRIESAWPKY